MAVSLQPDFRTIAYSSAIVINILIG